MYSVLQTPPDNWDEDSLIDQYTYTVIRSYDRGYTWHLYATMRSRADADDLARVLNWHQDIIDKAAKQGKIPIGSDIPLEESQQQSIIDLISES